MDIKVTLSVKEGQTVNQREMIFPNKSLSHLRITFLLICKSIGRNFITKKTKDISPLNKQKKN